MVPYRGIKTPHDQPDNIDFCLDFTFLLAVPLSSQLINQIQDRTDRITFPTWRHVQNSDKKSDALADAIACLFSGSDTFTQQPCLLLLTFILLPT